MYLSTYFTTLLHVFFLFFLFTFVGVIIIYPPPYYIGSILCVICLYTYATIAVSFGLCFTFRVCCLCCVVFCIFFILILLWRKIMFIKYVGYRMDDKIGKIKKYIDHKEKEGKRPFTYARGVIKKPFVVIGSLFKSKKKKRAELFLV